MTQTTPVESAYGLAPGEYPQRFREGEERARRIARPLKLISRVHTLDEALMQRLGRGFLECDEPGAVLARAIRAKKNEPHSVSMADFNQALTGGVESLENPGPALVQFFDAVTPEPDWLDWDLLERGARCYHRLGRNAADVLLQLALIGGYRFGGPTDLLLRTGGLSGDMTRRRLGETQKWATSLSKPGALRRHGEAWRLTLHVRAMHGLVNDTYLNNGQWDVAQWGLPINNSDQAATLGLFDAVALIGSRALGAPISKDDSRAVMHLWKYVGWLMGVHEDFLVDSEIERHRLNYHVLHAQSHQTVAGVQLTRSIVDVQTELFDGPLARVRGAYERERLLSMLTMFLGPKSMRELELPLRPPWAVGLAAARNAVLYQVIARLPRGTAVLDRWGDRVVSDVMRRYFGSDSPEVGKLPG